MKDFFKSTIGQKQLVAVGGLGLAAFVFAHMAGNMLIFVSPKAYNLYSHSLVTNPLIYLAEVGLLGIFLLHVILALGLALKNAGSRKVSYAMSPQKKAQAALFSRTMWAQGLVILAFVIFHLLTFKFSNHGYTVVYGNQEVHDLHRLVVEVFSQPIYVIGYVLTLLLMLAHLSHGLSSTFQSLGFSHPKYTPIIKSVGWVYSLVVVGGFISQPLYVYFLY